MTSLKNDDEPFGCKSSNFENFEKCRTSPSQQRIRIYSNFYLKSPREKVPIVKEREGANQAVVGRRARRLATSAGAGWGGGGASHGAPATPGVIWFLLHPWSPLLLLLLGNVQIRQFSSAGKRREKNPLLEEGGRKCSSVCWAEKKDAARVADRSSEALVSKLLPSGEHAPSARDDKQKKNKCVLWRNLRENERQADLVPSTTQICAFHSAVVLLYWESRSLRLE